MNLSRRSMLVGAAATALPIPVVAQQKAAPREGLAMMVLNGHIVTVDLNDNIPVVGAAYVIDDRRGGGLPYIFTPNALTNLGRSNKVVLTHHSGFYRDMAETIEVRVLGKVVGTQPA